MKKTFYILVTLGFGALIAMFVMHTWQNVAYVQTHGREGTLIIGLKYNASAWAKPLPIKKIHTYTATLAPNYDVVIESDQELVAGKQHFIRFLDRDDAEKMPPLPLRPVPGTLRMRMADDGTPLKVDSTAPMDRMVRKAIGPLGPLHDPPPTTAPVIVPGAHGAESVPFLLGGANETLFELIRGNSHASEWLVVIFALLFFQALLVNAWTLPWRANQPHRTRKGFVHPSLDTRDADPIPEPQKRIKFKPSSKSSDENPAPANPTSESAAPEIKLKLPRK